MPYNIAKNFLYVNRFTNNSRFTIFYSMTNKLCVSLSATAKKNIAFTDILDFSTRNGNIGIQVVEPNGYEGGCWYYITKFPNDYVILEGTKYDNLYTDKTKLDRLSTAIEKYRNLRAIEKL